VNALLAAGGGFLLAVLWMDLLFDVQVLRRGRREGPLPEDVLASIAGYYRHVTTRSRPMSHLVGAVMAVTVGGAALELARGAGPRAPAFAALLLAAGPVALAALRVVPSAVRLGARSDPIERQSALARTICRDHLLCLAGIAAFVALQLVAAAR
jgi:hypothetical protein